MDFNKMQKELVQECEQLHYLGVRHKGLSGTVCENLLMKKLRKSIPDIKFERGIIKLCKEENKGKDIKTHRDESDMSPQIDVIIYQGNEIFKSEGIVVVHIYQVLGVIEVKKWTSPQALDERNISDKKKANLEKLQELKNLLYLKSSRKITVFYVSFRFWSADDIWFNKIKTHEDNGIKFYCFYGKVHAKDKYPWDDKKRWENFENKEDNPYIDQYKELIENIQKLER